MVGITVSLVLEDPLNEATQVNLIETVVIPPRHQSILYAKVQTKTGIESFFEPNYNKLAEKGLIAPRALVENKNDLIPVEVTNASTAPIKLYKGTTLGSVESLPVSSLVMPVTQDNERVNLRFEEKRDYILNSTDFKDSIFDITQASHIQNLLLEYHELIATSNRELGEAKGVAHTIDVQNHPPIKEKLRRLRK